MIVHQSDLSSFARCAAACGYQRAGMPRRQLSATAYGSVIHHALEVFESERSSGTPFDQAVGTATATFLHYWNPVNISAICDPVAPDGWIARDSYNGLRARGVKAIEQYTALVRDADEDLLATEYTFMVPIEGTWDDELGEPHVLAGAVDKLVAKRMRRYEVLGLDDYKSGKQPTYLRQNMQFTAYAYASTRPEFWTGWRGEDGFGEEYGTELYQRFDGKARHGRWINLKDVKIVDVGFRGPLDYHRFTIAVEQFAASVKADIYPLTLVGEVCTYCDYRAVCAGSGVAKDDHGAPWAKNAA